MDNSTFFNRGFLYGDGFFETMRIYKNGIPLWSMHIERAQKAATFLGCTFLDQSSLVNLKSDILFQSALKEGIVRIDFYRAGEGTYAPKSTELKVAFSFRNLNNMSSSFLTKLDNFENEVSNLTPINVGIFESLKKPCNSLAEYKSSSALLYVKAGQFLNSDTMLDDVIILNEHGRICEGLSSNIIIKLNNQWIGVKKEEGPIQGVYQQFLARTLDLRLNPISIEDMRKAEVILLTNAASGITKAKLIR